jgi:hypothetical protein
MREYFVRTSFRQICFTYVHKKAAEQKIRTFNVDEIDTRDLKLRVTRGPHETQLKVSRATFKNVKKLPSNFQLKTKNS